MSSNICINEDFVDSTRIAVLQQTLNQKCSFDEIPIIKSSEVIEKLESQLNKSTAEVETCKQDLQMKSTEISSKSQKIKDLEAQVETHQQKIVKITNELEILRNQNEEKLKNAEVEKYESNITELKVDKMQCNNQINLFRELLQKLEMMWNATCLAETIELRSKVQIKLHENSILNEKITQKESEIIEKREEIKKLKSQNEVFGRY